MPPGKDTVTPHPPAAVLQHINAPVYGPVAGRDVYQFTGSHIAEHLPPASAAPAQAHTSRQRAALLNEVQALLAQVPSTWLPEVQSALTRYGGTGSLDDLTASQLHHLRWYAQVVLGRG